MKVCSSSFDDNKDEDLKVIDVSPIKSLYCNMNLDNDGTGDESTLVRRHRNDSEFLDLDRKNNKSGMGEVKTFNRLFFNRLYFLFAIHVKFSSCL